MQLSFRPNLAPEGDLPASSAAAHAAAAHSDIDPAEFRDEAPAPEPEPEPAEPAQPEETSSDAASDAPEEGAEDAATPPPAFNPEDESTWDEDTRKVKGQYKNSFELAKALRETKAHSLRQHQELQKLKAAPAATDDDGDGKPTPASATPAAITEADLTPDQRSEVSQTQASMARWADAFDANDAKIAENTKSITEGTVTLGEVQGQIKYLEKKLQATGLEDFARDAYKAELADARVEKQILETNIARWELTRDGLVNKNESLQGRYQDAKSYLGSVVRQVQQAKEATKREKAESASREARESGLLDSALDKAIKTFNVPKDAQEDFRNALLLAANSHSHTVGYIEDLDKFFDTQGRFHLRMVDKFKAPGVRAYVETKKADAKQPAPARSAPEVKTRPISSKEAHRIALQGSKNIPFS